MGQGDDNSEPLTPMGRLCVRPEHNHVIHCAIGLKNPVDIDTLKHHITNTVLLKIPRFTSLLALDPMDGSETWRPTQFNIDNHIFIHDNHDDNDNDDGHTSQEDMVNSILGDMALSKPMRLDMPLWELHILQDRKCLVMRVHHAVADGVSLMSMLWTIGRSKGEYDDDHHHGMAMSSTMNLKGHHHMHDGDGQGGNKKKVSANFSTKKRSKKMGLWDFLVFIWYSIVFGLKFVAKCLWVNDKVKVISGIDGVELWPRKVATARFRLADMKAIKKAIQNATIHDVLYGIVWCGLTRYLNARYPDQALQNGSQFNGMCPVNLREQPGLQRELDPLTYVARAKSVMNRKKLSMEARLSYNSVKYASKLLGSKVGGFLYYQLFCNTTFLLSNIPGPREEISIANNPVTFIRVSCSSQPQALTMHMVSYLEWADLQIQVAKDVIHDPKFLAKCFEDVLMEMKEATNDIVANN